MVLWSRIGFMFPKSNVKLLVTKEVTVSTLQGWEPISDPVLTLYSGKTGC